MRKIFTLGHSSLPWEEFLALLREYGIDVVVDVRRFPTSKKHPQFTKEPLARGLAEVGIRYE